MKIESYFANIGTANKALERLKSAGFSNAFVDLNDHYDPRRNVRTNLPGTETSPSLSGLVLESDSHVVDRSKGPLTAANPMVSGIGTFDEIADVNCRVIVEAGEGNADTARRIMKEMGGSLDNPNVEIPKNLENVNLENINLGNLNIGNLDR